MRMKRLVTAALAAAMVLSMTACGSDKDATTDTQAADTQATDAQATDAQATDAQATTAAADNGAAEGTVVITGSTSVEKIINEMKSEFEALNPGITIQYTGNGSSAGIKDTIAGSNNIGASSRELTEEEKKEGMTETQFAYDGIAIAVNPKNPVKNITMEQLQKIYAGEITNWKDLGGNDAEIYVVSREESSGTRSAFEELVKLNETDGLTSKAAVSEGNGPVQIAVAGNENAIGYVSFAYIDDTVKQLTVEGVDGTVENVKNNTYPLSRPFLFVSKDDKIGDAGKKFLEFALSADGQACVEKDNAIRIDK